MDSRSWANGEYKSCTSLNTKATSQTYLGCSPALSGEAKEFKVRFYGLTYDESKLEASHHNWKCRKNGDSDPTITCEIETPEVE